MRLTKRMTQLAFDKTIVRVIYFAAGKAGPLGRPPRSRSIARKCCAAGVSMASRMRRTIHGRKLDAQGFLPVGSCGADFAARLRKQYDHYGRVVREANIKAE
jgi:hypothetical protein